MPNNYRVVQWNTGNVGKSSLQSIADNPALELVGCYAWSPEKVGRDAGELVGMAPLGVAATDDIDALLALKPDCVVYNPMWIDVDELVRILSAGVNVVTTASFITGQNLGAGRDRIVEACQKGGSTMFGSGISPGFAELLAIVSAMVCDRVDKVTRHRSGRHDVLRLTGHREAGGLRPADRPPGAAADGGAGDGGFRRGRPDGGRRAGRRARRGALPGRVCRNHRRSRPRVLDHPGGMCRRRLRQLAGHRRRQDRVDLNVRWRKGQTLEPDWKIDQDGWVIQIDGQPTVTTKVGFLPPPYFEAETIADFMDARSHHDGNAPHQRDPGRRGRAAGHRHLRRSAAHAPPRLRQDLVPTRARCD